MSIIPRAYVVPNDTMAQYQNQFLPSPCEVPFTKNPQQSTLSLKNVEHEKMTSISVVSHQVHSDRYAAAIKRAKFFKFKMLRKTHFCDMARYINKGRISLGEFVHRFPVQVGGFKFIAYSLIRQCIRHSQINQVLVLFDTEHCFLYDWATFGLPIVPHENKKQRPYLVLENAFVSRRGQTGIYFKDLIMLNYERLVSELYRQDANTTSDCFSRIASVVEGTFGMNEYRGIFKKCEWDAYKQEGDEDMLYLLDNPFIGVHYQEQIIVNNDVPMVERTIMANEIQTDPDHTLTNNHTTENTIPTAVDEFNIGELDIDIDSIDDLYSDGVDINNM